MKKKIKKTIVSSIICASILCMLPMAVNAAHWYRVKGNLKTSVHYVPILKDTVTASTSITNPCTWSSAVSKTYAYAYAYDSSGNCKMGTGTAYDYQAVESWSVGHAKASIRAMVKAKGVHQAKSDCTDYKWVTVNTSWKK